VRQVVFDGLGAQVKLCGCLTIGHPAGHQRGDLPLLRGQPDQARVRIRPAAQAERGELGRHGIGERASAKPGQGLVRRPQPGERRRPPVGARETAAVLDVEQRLRDRAPQAVRQEAALLEHVLGLVEIPARARHAGSQPGAVHQRLAVIVGDRTCLKGVKRRGGLVEPTRPHQRPDQRRAPQAGGRVIAPVGDARHRPGRRRLQHLAGIVAGEAKHAASRRGEPHRAWSSRGPCRLLGGTDMSRCQLPLPAEGGDPGRHVVRERQVA
jgi:hypothetical protein